MGEFNLKQRAKMLMSLRRNSAKIAEKFADKDERAIAKERRRLNGKIIGGNFLFVEHFELIITTKCSLNCNGCSNLMPEYRRRKEAYFRDKTEIMHEIDMLLDAVDSVLNCRILGGEPMLHPDLAEILAYLLKKENVGSIHIITNGTIVPKGELMEALKNKRVIVIFSDYGKRSRNIEECCNILQKEKVNYNVNSSLKWSDLGDMKKREVSVEELTMQRKNCKFCCKTYLNGQFHLCPRSAFGTDLGYFDYPDDYLQLENMSLSERRKEIAEMLYSKPYIECCAHCLAGTEMAKPIDAGEQIE